MRNLSSVSAAPPALPHPRPPFPALTGLISAAPPALIGASTATVRLGVPYHLPFLQRVRIFPSAARLNRARSFKA
jgi:hypothetical protein